MSTSRWVNKVSDFAGANAPSRVTRDVCPRSRGTKFTPSLLVMAKILPGFGPSVLSFAPLLPSKPQPTLYEMV